MGAVRAIIIIAMSAVSLLASDAPWEQPRLATLSLQWRAQGGIDHYNVYHRSERTTNRWILLGSAANRTNSITTNAVIGQVTYRLTPVKTNDLITFSANVDLSVPVETVVTAVYPGGMESKPTLAVKHRSILPAPPPQHNVLWALPVPGTTNEPPRRNRAVPIRAGAMIPDNPPPLPP